MPRHLHQCVRHRSDVLGRADGDLLRYTPARGVSWGGSRWKSLLGLFIIPIDLPISACRTSCALVD